MFIYIRLVKTSDYCLLSNDGVGEEIANDTIYLFDDLHFRNRGLNLMKVKIFALLSPMACLNSDFIFAMTLLDSLPDISCLSKPSSHPTYFKKAFLYYIFSPANHLIQHHTFKNSISFHEFYLCLPIRFSVS